MYGKAGHPSRGSKNLQAIGVSVPAFIGAPPAEPVGEAGLLEVSLADENCGGAAADWFRCGVRRTGMGFCAIRDRR
jgi:hypothetical protein